MLQPKTHFPLFLDLRGRTVLVAGGGAVATRRVQTLCRFACRVRVAAPDATDELRRLAQDGRIAWLPRPFAPGDLEGAALAVAATSDREVNRRLGQLAQERGIPVSVADRREECTFFFPAVVETEELTIGLVGDGSSHHTVSAAARQLRALLKGE